MQGERLKHMTERVHELIMRSFVVFWEEGINPSSWKESHTWMPHKKGDGTELKHWRPITLTNSIYKLWTSVVARMLSGYAEQMKIFTDAQEGFRREKNN